jgi:hypothetical protein
MATNRYSTLAADFCRTHRPTTWATTPNRRSTFERIGDEIQTEITQLRDDLLGPPRPDEPPLNLLRRASQASATAEELILQHHPAFQPEPTTDPPTSETTDPALTTYRRHLAMLDETIAS